MTTKKPTSASPGSNFAWIRLSDFEALCFNLARQHLTFAEPIPDFVTRNPGILESCLATPLQQFNGKYLYPTFAEKMAMFFYLMIKNHPFQNGNKRVALTSLLVIAFLNKKWIKTDSLTMYRLAKDVARSKSKDKNKQVKEIARFIKGYTIKLNT